LVVAFGFAMCHMSWGVLSYRVTRTENNRTWFAFRMSQALKLVIFKILLSTVMYVLISVIVEPRNSASPTCNLQFAGINFFIVLLIDVLLTFALQTLFPTIHRLLHNNCCKAT
jgi:hypothetical protein